MRRLIAALTMLLAVTATPAGADPADGYADGASLLVWCNDDTPAMVARCINYMSGAIESHETLWGRGLMVDIGRSYCLPNGFTYEGLRGSVVGWLREHYQAIRVTFASVALYMALRDMFPCGVRSDRPA